MLVREYRESRGLDRAKLAEELSALLGRKIGARGVALKDNQQMPRSWGAALKLDGFPAPEPIRVEAAHPPDGRAGRSERVYGAASPPPGEDAADEGRARERPPTAPAGAAREASSAKVAAFARDRIAKAYSLVGFGLGKGLGNDGVTVVVDNFAPHIAEAWVKAAEENEFARRFVAFMSAGGVMGEVVSLHIAMLGGILYVKGVFPDVGLYSNYARYRESPHVEPPADEFAGNGAHADSSESPLGDFAGTA